MKTKRFILLFIITFFASFMLVSCKRDKEGDNPSGKTDPVVDYVEVLTKTETNYTMKMENEDAIGKSTTIIKFNGTEENNTLTSFKMEVTSEGTTFYCVFEDNNGSLITSHNGKYSVQKIPGDIIYSINNELSKYTPDLSVFKYNESSKMYEATLTIDGTTGTVKFKIEDGHVTYMESITEGYKVTYTCYDFGNTTVTLPEINTQDNRLTDVEIKLVLASLPYNYSCDQIVGNSTLGTDTITYAIDTDQTYSYFKSIIRYKGSSTPSYGVLQDGVFYDVEYNDSDDKWYGTAIDNYALAINNYNILQDLFVNLLSVSSYDYNKETGEYHASVPVGALAVEDEDIYFTISAGRVQLIRTDLFTIRNITYGVVNIDVPEFVIDDDSYDEITSDDWNVIFSEPYYNFKEEFTIDSLGVSMTKQMELDVSVSNGKVTNYVSKNTLSSGTYYIVLIDGILYEIKNQNNEWIGVKSATSISVDNYNGLYLDIICANFADYRYDSSTGLYKSINEIENFGYVSLGFKNNYLVYISYKSEMSTITAKLSYFNSVDIDLPNYRLTNTGLTYQEATRLVEALNYELTNYTFNIKNGPEEVTGEVVARKNEFGEYIDLHLHYILSSGEECYFAAIGDELARIEYDTEKEEWYAKAATLSETEYFEDNFDILYNVKQNILFFDEMTYYGPEDKYSITIDGIEFTLKLDAKGRLWEVAAKDGNNTETITISKIDKTFIELPDFNFEGKEDLSIYDYISIIETKLYNFNANIQEYSYKDNELKYFDTLVLAYDGSLIFNSDISYNAYMVINENNEMTYAYEVGNDGEYTIIGLVDNEYVGYKQSISYVKDIFIPEIKDILLMIKENFDEFKYDEESKGYVYSEVSDEEELRVIIHSISLYSISIAIYEGDDLTRFSLSNVTSSIVEVPSYTLDE